MPDEMRKSIEIFLLLQTKCFHSLRLHYACALQRSHLVQLYLSCLDFNIEAKDYEGNTCLHYAAITGTFKRKLVSSGKMFFFFKVIVKLQNYLSDQQKSLVFVSINTSIEKVNSVLFL